MRLFDESMSLEIRANNGDIEEYLDRNMGQLSAFDEWSQQLRDEIKSAISDAVDGMYVSGQYLHEIFILEEKFDSSYIRFLVPANAVHSFWLASAAEQLHSFACKLSIFRRQVELL
jgi:hypothetical protein